MLHFDKEAVAAIVEDADNSRVLLVEAYRYVVGSIQWEVPAGSIDPCETAIDAAAREVREESGYATVNHQAVAVFEPINGIGDKVHHLVLCQAVGEQGSFDANEVRAVRWVSRKRKWKRWCARDRYATATRSRGCSGGSGSADRVV